MLGTRSQILGTAQIQQINVPLHPTILVGLGGTGKEVLLRLRMKFFEKYGVPSFPTMAYLWIDTDSNLAIESEELDNYILQQVMFRPGEIIDAQVPPEEFQGYFKNPQAHPHIFSWLYPGLSEYAGIQDGAKAIRPFGRLGFFHAFNDIQNKFRTASNKVGAAGAINQMLTTYNATVNAAQMDIYIVCSLAGGTGSGMFLDAAFLAKRMFPNAKIVGYLVLPDVFPGNYRANAYAALKELEFYSLREDVREHPAVNGDEGVATQESFHDFEVEWELGNPEKIIGPPFQFCYFIDNKTRSGGVILPDQRVQLFDMIAENIFTEFSDDTDTFALRKRSARENLSQFLLRDLEYDYLDENAEPIYTEIFSYRYSTFGLSKIYIPTDRIRNACAYKLAEDIVDFWLQENNPQGDIKQYVFKNIIPNLELRIDPQSRTNDFIEALRVENDAEANSLYDVIDDWAQSIDKSSRQQVKDTKAELSTPIQNAYTTFVTEHFNMPGDPEEWGSFVRRVKNVNKNKFLTNARRLLSQEVVRMLDNPRIRFDLAIAYLSQISAILDDHIDYFERARDAASQQLRELNDQIRKDIDQVHQAESGWLFRQTGIKAKAPKAINRMKTALTRRAQQLIFETAIEICEELKKAVGYETQMEETQDGQIQYKREGLIKDLRDIQGKLKDKLKPSLHKKFKDFDSVQPHLIHENLYEQGMYDDFYKIDGKAAKNELRNMETGFFDESGIGGVFALKKAIDESGWQNIEANLTAFCQKHFVNIQITSEAVRKFFEKYPEASETHKSRVQRFVDMGLGWLRKGGHFMGDATVLSNMERQSYLGIAQNQHDNYNSLRDSIGQIQDGVQPEPVAPSLACFYSEYAGLPLMYIDGLPQYKQAYLNEARQENSALHIDRRDYKFDDILLKSPEEVQASIEANRILLIGSMLGVVTIVENDDESFSYSYIDNPGTPREKDRPLGREHIAVETLKKNSRLRQQLDNQITTKVMGFSQEQRLQFYALLKYYDDEVFPERFYQVGGTIIEKSSQKRRAIVSMLKAEEEAISPSIMPIAQLVAEADRLAQRLDDFSKQLETSNRRVLKEG